MAGDRSLFDLRRANDELLKCLRERFADAILKSAGVVNADSEGQVALAPTLAQNRSGILAVRSRRTDKVVDLIFATGETLTGASSFARSITERQIYGRIREGHPLFVASTAEDRAVLRYIGVPISPLRAFERLGVVEIRRLQRLLGKGPVLDHRRRPDSDNSPTLGERVRLVFVNWSPARLDDADVPAALKVAAQLQRLDGELRLRLPLYNILVWKPSLSWIKRVLCPRLAYGFERDILQDLADIDFDCKRLHPGSSESRPAETSAPLSGPRAAAAAEWCDCTELPSSPCQADE